MTRKQLAATRASGQRSVADSWTVQSLLVSAACHLAALVVLGLLVAASGDSAGSVQLLADRADRPDLPPAENSFPVVTLDATGALSAAAGPQTVFDVPPIAAADFAPLDPLAMVAPQASGLDGMGVAHLGTNATASLRGGAEFFGIGSVGETFVYIVDSSGSMRDDNRFRRATYELLQSLEQLASYQRYYVIFFSDEAYPLASNRPLPATEENLERTRRWVRAFRPRGHTYPLEALRLALSLEPDAVFFLSDGIFDPRTIQEVHMANLSRSRPIPIHTIAFVEAEARGLMWAIAHDSGGEFRFVR